MRGENRYNISITLTIHANKLFAIYTCNNVWIHDNQDIFW